ncbi:MAG: diguanylate cyclase [Lachnospiraceae bacterium]|nr:diguanylate cyclase [Lachnospiraceae bacterium]
MRKRIHVFLSGFIILCMTINTICTAPSARASEAKNIEIDLTPEEYQYISQNDEIKLAFLVTRPPFSFIGEDGELSGIYRDIMQWVQENTGLQFSYVMVPAGENPVEFVNDGNADVAVGVFHYGDNLTNPDIMMTDTFFESDMVLVAKKGAAIDMSEPLKVLVSKGYRMGYQYLTDAFPDYEVDYAENVEASLKAVQKGEADLAFQNVYVMNEYLTRPAYRDLSLFKSSLTGEKLACAVSAKEDALLVSILNKAFAAMPEEFIWQLIADYTITRRYYPSLLEYVSDNLLLFISVQLVILIIPIVLFLYLRLRNRKKMMNIILKSEEQLRSITNNISGGVISIEKCGDFIIQYANDCFWQIAGIDKHINEESDRNFMNFVASYDRIQVLSAFEQIWRTECPMEIKFNLQREDTVLPVLLKGRIYNDFDGRKNILCILIDIQREEALKEAIEDEKEMYRIFVDEAKDIVFHVDWTTKEFHWPDYWESRFGYTPPKSFGLGDELAPLTQMVVKEDIPVLHKMINSLKMGEASVEANMRLRYANGLFKWHRIQVKRMEKNKHLYRLLGKMTDIDSEVHRMQQLSDASMRDKLTGLYNKAAFYTLVAETVNSEDEGGVLLFLDLDNFKSVNDLMGHLAGDEILVNVADGMKKVFRSNDIIARFGGDEFVVYAKGIDDDEAVNKIQALRTEIARVKKECDAEKTGLSVCIGVSVYPLDADNVEELVQRADEAMYQIKQNGKDGYAFYKRN